MFDEEEGPPAIARFRRAWCEWYVRRTGVAMVEAFREFAYHSRICEARRVHYLCTEARKRHDPAKSFVTPHPGLMRLTGQVYTELVIRLFQRGNHA